MSCLPRHTRARHGGTKGETNCCVHSGIPFLGGRNTKRGLATSIGTQTSTFLVADQAELWHICLRCALPAELMSCLSRLLTSPGWGAATRKGKQTVVFSQGHYFKSGPATCQEAQMVTFGFLYKVRFCPSGCLFPAFMHFALCARESLRVTTSPEASEGDTAARESKQNVAFAQEHHC